MAPRGPRRPAAPRAEQLERSLDVFPVGRARSSPTTSPSSGTIHRRRSHRGWRPPRSCKLQAKSHLIHLRKGFLEARGSEGNGLPDRIVSHGFRALLGNIARLNRGPVRPGAPESGDRALAAFAEHTIGVRNRWCSRCSASSRPPGRLRIPAGSSAATWRRQNGSGNTWTDGTADDVAPRARLAIFCLVLSQCPAALAQPLPPQLTAPVNDFAHVIDSSSAQEIDRRVRALEKATGDVVVVATVPTFQP